MKVLLPSPNSSRWLSAIIERWRERHVAFVRRYLLCFTATVVLVSGLFHAAMALEGQDHPWWVGPYWAISTMTTLGLGDIWFEDWPGQMLTAVTVLAGIVLMLVLLPLLLIQLPQWVEVRSASRVRREVPRNMRGHVVLTHRDPITEHLVERLRVHGTPYVLIVSDLQEGLRLSELGWSIMIGEPDSPDTYRAARLNQAALLAATGNDMRNSNAVFTARSVAPNVPILATADRSISVGVLQLAGSTHVLQLTAVMASSLSRRVLGGDALAHVVGSFGDVLVAEANAARTPLVGKRLRDTNLRDMVDVSVVGTWNRGEFEVIGRETEIGPHTVLVLAGTREQLDDYDLTMAIYNVSSDPVVVIGGGRVGRATAQALALRGIDYRVVEIKPLLCTDEHFVQGDAADPAVLERAGINSTPTVVITTRDDDANTFMALYCRRLRPDVHIIARATFDRNVETLHRAGTDFVLSTASLGSSSIFKLLEGGDTVTITEGLEMFQVQLPPNLVGRTLAECNLRRETGCTVVALRTAEGTRTDIDPHAELPPDAEAVLIGTRDAEARFFERFK